MWRDDRTGIKGDDKGSKVTLSNIMTGSCGDPFVIPCPQKTCHWKGEKEYIGLSKCDYSVKRR